MATAHAQQQVAAVPSPQNASVSAQQKKGPGPSLTQPGWRISAPPSSPPRQNARSAYTSFEGHNFSQVRIQAALQASGHVLQLASDPSPPADLKLDEALVPTPGGEPSPDGGEAIAELDAQVGSGEPPSGESTEEEQEEEETPPVQASFDGPPASGPVAADRIASGLGSGQSLARGVQQQMGAFLGHDFSHVRVHTDAQADGYAKALHAHAFTIGDQIAFRAGLYRPDAVAGQKLIAHELTHVVQQSKGLGDDILHAGIGKSGDRYEQEAERNAARFERGETAERSAGGDSSPLQSASVQRHLAALQLYSGSTAAAYAQKWAKGTNSSYPRFDNDCTNFVSQAVEAGGWAMEGGSCDDRKSDSAWWYGSSKCWYPTVRASYTWAGAQNFYNFVAASSRGTVATKVADLVIGDVLQMAFSGTHIGHTMMVTDKKEGNLFLSYHTSDNLDRNFWGKGGIHEAYPKANYYAWSL